MIRFALVALLVACSPVQDRPGQPYLFVPPPREGEASFSDKVQDVETQWANCLGVDTADATPRAVCMACPEFLDRNFYTECWEGLQDRCLEVEYECVIYCEMEGCQ